MLLYYNMLYYTIIYYTILYYTILYYTILYYTILYYTILSVMLLIYYDIPCCAILARGPAQRAGVRDVFTGALYVQLSNVQSGKIGPDPRSFDLFEDVRGHVGVEMSNVSGTRGPRFELSRS